MARLTEELRETGEGICNSGEGEIDGIYTQRDSRGLDEA